MEWKKAKLGDVCSRLKSGKGIHSSDVHNCGKYPVIGGNGVRGYADVSNFSGACGIIGRQGAYCGNVRFFRGEAYMTEHAIVVIGDENTNTYYLTQLLSTMQLGHLSAQSAQPGLSVQTLSKQLITLPPLEYQEKVAAILSSLDDKIENNNRINRNLEAQAQALFKSWFVDFEPWGGTMPEDWKEGTLGEFLIESKEKVGNRVVEEYSVGKQGIRKRSEIYHKQITSTPASNKLLLKGQIAFGMGSGCVDWGVMTDEIGATSPAYTVYSISKIIPTDYFKRFFAIKHAKALDLVKPSVRQGQGLDKGVLLNKYIYIPIEEVWTDFVKIYEPLHTKIANNQKESARLAALRDTLLPKLMRGEITL